MSGGPKLLFAAFSTALPLFSALPASSRMAAPAREVVGEVHFATSCTPAAQAQFDRAVAELHSFWYEESAKAFTAVAGADPSCAMAYWGVAMSHWHPLWYPPGEAALRAGGAAVEKAKAIGANTQRENDYIAAIDAFYKDWEHLDHRARGLAYEKAMAELYARHPEDREAAVFYALALDATAPAGDKTYANQLKAAAILEKVFAERPDHPGAAHYLIHSYDSAALAERGLAAARHYAAIAPAVPHALHMPSHIFTRLGLWNQSIESNHAAHQVARAYAERTIGPHAWDQETLHTLDYMAYAHLQLAQDRAAKAIVDDLATFRTGPVGLPAAYAVAAIPSRYVLERRRWDEAAALRRPAIPFPLERFPWAEAIISYTRALGAARIGDRAGARSELAKLQALRGLLRQANNAYWANQVEAQFLGASAALARAEGKNADALAQARAAADLEDSLEKHPATPAPVLPARELLAELLLELGHPALALEQYHQVLVAEPNRFHGILGTARAAKQLGDWDKATGAYKMLLAQCEAADTERPELAEAREFLAFVKQ